MKLGTFIAPFLIAVLTFIFVWAMGMMVVKSSAMATQSSIELLRLQMEVTKMQNLLHKNSQQDLEKQLEALEESSQKQTSEHEIRAGALR